MPAIPSEEEIAKLLNGMDEASCRFAIAGLLTRSPRGSPEHERALMQILSLADSLAGRTPSVAVVRRSALIVVSAWIRVNVLACLNTFKLPRLWDLLAYWMPPGIRLRMYQPVIGALENDRREAYKKYRGFFARTSLRAAFLLRTIVVMLACYKAWGVEGMITRYAWLAPQRLRDWWRSFKP